MASNDRDRLGGTAQLRRQSGGLSMVGTRNRERERERDSIESTLNPQKETPSKTYLGKLRLVTTRGRTYGAPMQRVLGRDSGS